MTNPKRPLVLRYCSTQRITNRADRSCVGANLISFCRPLSSHMPLNASFSPPGHVPIRKPWRIAYKNINTIARLRQPGGPSEITNVVTPDMISALIMKVTHVVKGLLDCRSIVLGRSNTFRRFASTLAGDRIGRDVKPCGQDRLQDHQRFVCSPLHGRGISDDRSNVGSRSPLDH